MNSIQISGLALNLIIYIIILFPIIIISFNKKNYNSKKSFIIVLIYSTIIEIFFSLIIYCFPEKIFSLFTKKNGIINFAVYCSKILFITSCFFSLKILIPSYLFNNNLQKKSVILVLTKITATLLFAYTFYIFFNTKGLLFSFPFCDFIFYIIYILNIIR